VLSLHVIWSIGIPIALVESRFPRRRTEPWLHTPGLIIIAMLCVLGLLAAFGTTWLEYRHVASPVHLIGVALVALILIIEAAAVIAITLWSRRPDWVTSRSWHWQPALSSPTPGTRS